MMGKNGKKSSETSKLSRWSCGLCCSSKKYGDSTVSDEPQPKPLKQKNDKKVHKQPRTERKEKLDDNIDSDEHTERISPETLSDVGNQNISRRPPNYEKDENNGQVKHVGSDKVTNKKHDNMTRKTNGGDDLIDGSGSKDADDYPDVPFIDADNATDETDMKNESETPEHDLYRSFKTKGSNIPSNVPLKQSQATNSTINGTGKLKFEESDETLENEEIPAVVHIDISSPVQSFLDKTSAETLDDNVSHEGKDIKDEETINKRHVLIETVNKERTNHEVRAEVYYSPKGEPDTNNTLGDDVVRDDVDSEDTDASPDVIGRSNDINDSGPSTENYEDPSNELGNDKNSDVSTNNTDGPNVINDLQESISNSENQLLTSCVGDVMSPIPRQEEIEDSDSSIEGSLHSTDNGDKAGIVSTDETAIDEEDDVNNIKENNVVSTTFESHKTEKYGILETNKKSDNGEHLDYQDQRGDAFSSNDESFESISGRTPLSTNDFSATEGTEVVSPGLPKTGIAKILAPQTKNEQDPLPTEIELPSGPTEILPPFSDNIKFYKNEIHSRPAVGFKIEDMLQWFGNYELLERNHTYIQWLFPISEGSGMNYQAQRLLEHEADYIKSHQELKDRVFRSFKMMLDFYGMAIVNGEFCRNEDNWEARYKHLNSSFHNRMRITRIIRCLGELGFEKFQTKWLAFLMKEAMVTKKLNRLGGNSMEYFIDAIKEDSDREKIFAKYFRYMSEDVSGSDKEDEKDACQDDVGENNASAGGGQSGEVGNEEQLSGETTTSEENNENNDDVANTSIIDSNVNGIESDIVTGIEHSDDSHKHDATIREKTHTEVKHEQMISGVNAENCENDYIDFENSVNGMKSSNNVVDVKLIGNMDTVEVNKTQSADESQTELCEESDNHEQVAASKTDDGYKQKDDAKTIDLDKTVVTNSANAEMVNAYNVEDGQQINADVDKVQDNNTVDTESYESNGNGSESSSRDELSNVYCHDKNHGENTNNAKGTGSPTDYDPYKEVRDTGDDLGKNEGKQEANAEVIADDKKEFEKTALNVNDKEQPCKTGSEENLSGMTNLSDKHDYKDGMDGNLNTYSNNINPPDIEDNGELSGAEKTLHGQNTTHPDNITGLHEHPDENMQTGETGNNNLGTADGKLLNDNVDHNDRKVIEMKNTRNGDDGKDRKAEINDNGDSDPENSDRVEQHDVNINNGELEGNINTVRVNDGRIDNVSNLDNVPNDLAYPVYDNQIYNEKQASLQEPTTDTDLNKKTYVDLTDTDLNGADNDVDEELKRVATDEAKNDKGSDTDEHKNYINNLDASDDESETNYSTAEEDDIDVGKGTVNTDDDNTTEGINDAEKSSETIKTNNVNSDQKITQPDIIASRENIEPAGDPLKEQYHSMDSISDANDISENDKQKTEKLGIDSESDDRDTDTKLESTDIIEAAAENLQQDCE